MSPKDLTQLLDTGFFHADPHPGEPCVLAYGGEIGIPRFEPAMYALLNETKNVKYKSIQQ